MANKKNSAIEKIQLEIRSFNNENLELNHFVVAFSGGADSTLLLEALQQLQSEKLTAIYINHHLHSESNVWQEHCKKFCSSRGVNFLAIDIEVPKRKGQSLEASAREIRYKHLFDYLDERSCLLTGHHQDDQFETYLMRMIKGTTLKGLQGIRRYRKLEKGHLFRPMLNIPREEILDELNSLSIEFIEDPSNLSDDFDRNKIRNNITPLLNHYFPKGSNNLVRTLDEINQQLFFVHSEYDSKIKEIIDKGFIDESIKSIPIGLRRGLIKRLVYVLSNKYPSDCLVTLILEQFDAKTFASKKLFEINRLEFWLFKNKIYFFEKLDLQINQYFGEINFEVEKDSVNVLPIEWSLDHLKVTHIKNINKIIPWNASNHKTLKNILNEKNIFPWLRPYVPLIYYKDTLVAVSNLCISDLAREQIMGEKNYKVKWDVPVKPYV